MLGEVTFRCLALGLAVAGSLPRPAIKPFDADLFWRDNLMRALFAKELAEQQEFPAASEVFSAALLQNMGIPLLLNRFGDDYQAVLERFELGREPLHDLEVLKYGWNHTLFGGWVAERWRFPKSMVLAIRHHHDPITTIGETEGENRLIGWTQLSSLLPSSIVEGPARWRKANDSLRSVLPNAPYARIAEKVDQSFGELASLFQEGDGNAVGLADRLAAR